jgi:ribA/ribD-fused uncharacterized protein
MKATNELTTDNFIFFWNGIYSQWHPSRFSIAGIEYNCCEQYMMAMKALTFNDQESYDMIMYANNPRDQKAFGRRVKGFDTERWNEVCREFVYQGNLAKFTQNLNFKDELMKTGDKEIVEASPYDAIWGIGMGVDHADIMDKSKWQGTNWLGEAIIRVRETINNNNK